MAGGTIEGKEEYTSRRGKGRREIRRLAEEEKKREKEGKQKGRKEGGKC